MSSQENKIKEFLVCVVDPNHESDDNTVLLHPALRVFNPANSDSYDSPAQAISSVQQQYPGKKIVAVNKETVSESTWEWLLSELREDTLKKQGWQVDKDILIEA